MEDFPIVGQCHALTVFRYIILHNQSSDETGNVRMSHNIPHPPSPQIVIEILFGASPMVVFALNEMYRLIGAVKLEMTTVRVKEHREKILLANWNENVAEGIVV